MECKSYLKSKSHLSGRGINRNIVECKYVSMIFSNCFRLIELIETLWNVNIEGIKASADISSELIETLWNVNVKKVMR